ncbi:MAG: YvcK family protein [Ardenticatenaceae bacterium]|nr:YvcK family protein [Anaerolineales bacterium]MCB8922375.1 YvcK family protein [Ardenticatenaceae bacterium]MCB8991307.1 YvcK family protein [Ardenticatenaceae bacterium]
MNVVCLAGGTGGAKLADGLAQILSPAELTIVVNTGDDFRQSGLLVCPDLDAVMAMLAGVNAEREAESWYSLRSQWLAEGRSLTAVTHYLCQQVHIQHNLLPMSDHPVPTEIVTADGRTLSVHAWFTQEDSPAVAQMRFPDNARATPQVMKRLERADLVIIAPSNPFVSIDPILNVYPIRAMLEDIPQAVIAVAPMLDETLGKMMQGMGMDVAVTAVANHYGDLIDGFIYDLQQAVELDHAGITTLCVNTLMQTADDRCRLAQNVLNFAQQFVIHNS